VEKSKRSKSIYNWLIQSLYCCQDSGADSSDDEESADVDLEELKMIPVDDGTPGPYRTKMTHSLRADKLVQSGLNISQM